jgi:hypothetical protein
MEILKQKEMGLLLVSWQLRQDQNDKNDTNKLAYLLFL